MKINKTITIYIIAGILILSNVYLFYKTFHKDIVYVNTSILISNFNYAKELEQQYNNSFQENEKIILEMENKLNELITGKTELTDAEIEQYRLLEAEYQQKAKQIYQENSELEAHYNELMITRLNDYVYEYGKKHNQSIILGATGNGSIMYAEESMDITEDVLIFINEKYEGE